MPENWKTYQFANAPLIILDGDRGKNYPKSSEFKTYGHCLFLSAKNVTKTGFQFSEKFFISTERDQLLRKGKLERYDLVLTTRGTVGNVAYYGDSVPFEHIRINSGMLILRVKKEALEDKFLYFFLRSPYFENQVLSNQTGSAQPQLPIRDLKTLKINLPPLSEQKSITSILSALDDKIELNLQMNKTLEEMAMALYKHWFVDFGPFQDGEFVDSELGEIPKGWEVKTIGELYNTTSGGTPSRKKPEYYNDGDINWVKSKELYGNFVIDTEEKINHLGLKKSSAKILPPKSVLLAMYGATVGESSILSIEATCNQAICAILEKELSFVYIFLYLRIFKTDILNQATGSAQQNISQQIIKNIPIVSPPAGLKVYNELEQYYALIEQNVFENKNLTQLRDTLLPKLISGEVRVKDVEKTLSEVL